MRNILIDAGPIIAFFDKSDQYHVRSLHFLNGFEGELWTTWPVITEACHMLDFHQQAQFNFLKWIDRGGLGICPLDQIHVERLLELTLKFRDVPIDLADASLIVASELTGYDEIASIDSDFYIYRDIRNQYLTNVFFNN